MSVAPHRPSLAPREGETGPRRALILAGGGMRVAWQAGVLRALAEEGLTFFHADGTSGGTMNLSLLLSGLSPLEICARWTTLDVSRFVSLLPLDEYLKGTRVPAMGDADGLRDHVFPHLGVDVARIRAAVGMSGTFNVCNYTQKTNVAVPNSAIDLDLLVAGVSLPIFLPPVRHGGDLWLDSVWIKDANLMEAVRRGAEELWLVWCIGNVDVYRDGPFPQYVHMIELSANGGLFEEFDRIRELNERIARGDSPHGQKAPVRLHVIRPEQALPLDPEFTLGRIDAATLIELGYQAARRYLATREAGGIPLTPEATKMKTSTLGLSFREKMAGPFALGKADPAEGDAAGRAAGSALALHGSIYIDDVARFAADRDHAATLSGTVDFTPFGEGLAGRDGVFNLFSPGGDTGTKLMIYRLGFAHGGKSYFLAGQKLVHDDPGFDLWTDTTTLFTKLHEGRDETGPVVGAGILRLGVADLIALVSTLRAVNAEAPGDGFRAVETFGALFLGELWKTYVQHLPTSAPE